MQTVYFTTRNFVRRQGNVVDLEEYRRRLQARENAAALPEQSPLLWDAPFEEEPEEEREAAPRRTAKKRSAARGLLTGAGMADLCATLAIVVMAVTVVIRFLQL